MDSLRAKWEEAVKRWEDSANEFIPVQQRKRKFDFENYEDLLRDLQKQDEDPLSDSSTRNMIRQLYPYLDTFKSLLPVIILALDLHERRIEVAVVWALVHLGIKALINTHQKAKVISEAISILEMRLKDFENYTKDLFKRPEADDNDDDIGDAFVDMFTAMIDFWVQVKIYQGDQFNPVRFNNDLERTSKRTSISVDRVQNLLMLKASRITFLRTAALPQASMTRLNIDENDAQLPCYAIPAIRQYFTANEELQALIDTHFDGSKDTRQLHSYAVHGEGGVGKTSFALHYAHQCRLSGKYSAIFWIRSQDEFTTRESWTEIAHSLKLSSPASGKSDNDPILVKNWLNSTSITWLLIFDNVEESNLLKNNIPSSCGNVLVTTRHARIATSMSGISKHAIITPFDLNKSISLFQEFRRYKQPDNKKQEHVEHDVDSLNELMKICGGLALGIEHMAACIVMEERTVKEFVERYNRLTKIYITKKETVGGHAAQNLDTFWAITLQKVEQHTEDGPNAIKLLRILSTISPDSIPESIFSLEDEESELARILTPITDFCGDIVEVEAAVQLLKDFALIKSGAHISISIHRLLQEFVFFSLEPAEAQQVFDSAVKLINHAFPKQVNSRPMYDKWQECDRAVKHTKALATLYHRLAKLRRFKLKATEELAELMKNCIWYLYELGDFKDALSLVNIAYTMCEDKHSLVYAHLCNSDFACSFQLNDLRRSREKVDLSLAIRRAKLPSAETHLDMAASYSNFAQSESADGKQAEALKFLEKARQIRTAAGFGEDAISGLGLLIEGRCFFLDKKYAEASDKFAAADAIFSKTLGNESQFMAYLIFDRANLLRITHSLPVARAEYERGLKISEVVGKAHILTAAFYYKVGLMYASEHKHEEALINFNSALEITIDKDYLGDTARIYRQKALVLEKQADANEQILEQANVLKVEANNIKTRLTREYGLQEAMEYAGTNYPGDEEKQYDQLVCLYYR